MIETSRMNITEALLHDQSLSKGMKVTLPIGESAEIYGFVAIENEVFNTIFDMPPIGEAHVLSNRIIFQSNNQSYAFPIFNSVCKATDEKYELHMLYIPRFLTITSEWERNAYIYSLKNENPHPKVFRIDKRIKIEDSKAYYYPDSTDLAFQSTSTLRGIAKGLAIITRRITRISENIKYEIFNSTEVLIEKP